MDVNFVKYESLHYLDTRVSALPPLFSHCKVSTGEKYDNYQ